MREQIVLRKCYTIVRVLVVSIHLTKEVGILNTRQSTKYVRPILHLQSSAPLVTKFENRFKLLPPRRLCVKLGKAALHSPVVCGVIGNATLRDLGEPFGVIVEDESRVCELSDNCSISGPSLKSRVNCARNYAWKPRIRTFTYRIICPR